MFDDSTRRSASCPLLIAAALAGVPASAAVITQGPFTDGGPAQNSGNFLETTGSFGTVTSGAADFTLDFAIPTGLPIGTYTLSFDIRLNDRPDIQVSSFPRTDGADNQSFNNNVFVNDTGLNATPLDTWVRRQATITVTPTPTTPTTNLVWNGVFRTGSRLLVAQTDPTDMFDVDLDNISIVENVSGSQQLLRLFTFENDEVGTAPANVTLTGTAGTDRTVVVRAVPEPASLVLLSLGGVLLAGRGKRQ